MHSASTNANGQPLRQRNQLQIIATVLRPLPRLASLTIIAGCCLHAVATFAAAEATPASRPNFVFVLTDDMGYGDPGCYGGKFAPTANIDRLAREGLRF